MRKPWQPRPRTPWGRQGRSQQYLIQRENWKNSIHMGTSIVSTRNGATGSDRSPPSGPEEQEKPTRRWVRAKATALNTNGVSETQPSRGAQTLAANPSDDPSTKERDEWKARTKIEGDSKAPSASTASSTCRKAGAWGKHIPSVVTTGEHNRVRKESWTRTTKESRTGTRKPSRRTDKPVRLRL